MEIVYKSIDELTPYENNPRHNENAVAAVAASIKEFNFKVPLVIDTNGVVVAGHTRLLAARQLGLSAVPCIVADDLTDEQIRAFRLADNKTAELAGWNFSNCVYRGDAAAYAFNYGHYASMLESRIRNYYCSSDCIHYKKGF